MYGLHGGASSVGKPATYIKIIKHLSHSAAESEMMYFCTSEFFGVRMVGQTNQTMYSYQLGKCIAVSPKILHKKQLLQKMEKHNQ